jgi:hypothetical protein
MMELEGAVVPAVAAEETAAPGLAHKHFLDPSTPARGSLRSTSQAAVAAPPLENEVRHPVVCASAPEQSSPVPTGRSCFGPFDGRNSLQPELPEPVPHSRPAHPEPISDLSDRRSGIDLGYERVIRHDATSRVPVAVRSLEAVLLDPVTDGRTVASDPPPDLLERESLGQPLRKRLAFHASIVTPGTDRKTNVCSRARALAGPPRTTRPSCP